MKTYGLLFIFMSFFAQAALQKINGFDVRDKSERYEIGISKENAILEERRVELFRLDGKSRIKVKDFDVVYVSEDIDKDVDAVYANSEGTLQFGRMKKDPRTKQLGRVVVLKLNPESKNRKTLVFEAPASLE